ncbi:helix-turn-helix transcriptional regulator [Nocardioides sp. 1609]|uniref:helix-turn-helix transcriptional regulator n=1 Tax=Nocardioides sp. 1609 TaxID=2508327 RepID=UPI00106F7A77|nr:helix-turn-helix transcriptional regulator [Nocardioides sp. 1609]
MQERNALGEFLRSRRERLRPQDVGMPAHGRRRTPGLRREEVATLAMLSPDYYSRLEQGRVRTPSESALNSLARALRLTGDEVEHLFRLSGQRPPEPHTPRSYVDPAMSYLLDVLDGAAAGTPAQVADDLLTVVAQNRTAQALLGTWVGLPRFESNVTWRWFADPSSRALNDPTEHEEIGRTYAADLRAGLGQRSARDVHAQALVDDLLKRSEEFRRVWEEQAVAALSSTPKLIHHPVVGDLDLQCDVVLSPATGHRLIIFRSRVGSDAIDKLGLLSVLGQQTFD